jgi:mannosyltransferase OCH1-like enzyme
MIPKALQQVWLGPRRCPIEAINTWKYKNPGLEHKLWTEADLPNLTLRNQELFDAFNGVYHAQADILRYELLYQFGGLAFDADSICIRALDDRFFEVQAGAWACSENNNGLLACGFMGSEPQHPLFKAVLDELANLDVEAIKNEDRQELYGATWVLTGPCCLSEVVKASGIQLKTFPGHWFFPTHHDGTEYIGDDKPWAYHWWGTTHKSYENPVVIEAIKKLIKENS